MFVFFIFFFIFWVSRTIKQKMTNFSFLLRLYICLFFFYLGSRLPQEIIIQGHLPPHAIACTVLFDEKWGIRESYSLVPKRNWKKRRKNWNLFIRSVDELCRILGKVEKMKKIYFLSQMGCVFDVYIHSLSYHTNQIT